MTTRHTDVNQHPIISAIQILTGILPDVRGYGRQILIVHTLLFYANLVLWKDPVVVGCDFWFSSAAALLVILPVVGLVDTRAVANAFALGANKWRSTAMGVSGMK